MACEWMWHLSANPSFESFGRIYMAAHRQVLILISTLLRNTYLMSFDC